MLGVPAVLGVPVGVVAVQMLRAPSRRLPKVCWGLLPPLPQGTPNSSVVYSTEDECMSCYAMCVCRYNTDIYTHCIIDAQR